MKTFASGLCSLHTRTGRLMGNMCCFVEPISLELMQKRAKSGREVMDALRALGITPVPSGVSGELSRLTSKRKCLARMWWCRRNRGMGFKGQDGLIRAMMPLQSLLGPSTSIRASSSATAHSTDMETFQEGGVSGDVPVGAGAIAIQKALNKASS